MEIAADAEAGLRDVEVSLAEGGRLFLPQQTLIMIFDLDVDSDNNNGYDLPSRTSAEEDVEDVENDDARPGKVIIVGNGDSDKDGFPDYADGFNAFDVTAKDDSSPGSKFAPLVLEINGWARINESKIVVEYDASDPAAMEPGFDEPFALPGGRLRLWKKDGSDSRNKAPVWDGGDYVAPGEYSPAELGAGTGPVVLYVEAVRESEKTADLPIRVRMKLDGTSVVLCEAAVRVTAAKLEILAHDPVCGMFETDRFVKMGFPDSSAYSGNGAAPGAFQKYSVRVRDPRRHLRTLYLDGQAVPLRWAGRFHETERSAACIGPEERHLLDRNKEFAISFDSIFKRGYNGLSPPDDAAADPARWEISKQGCPVVEARDGILDMDSSGGEFKYSVTLADSAHWQWTSTSVLEVRFRILGWDEQGKDGAFKVVFGDSVNEWEIGIKPKAVVSYDRRIRSEVALPGEIGAKGDILDGFFHVLRIENSGGGNIRLTIDPDRNDWSLTVGGRNAVGPARICWGDTGSDTRGHVQYDYIKWWYSSPGPVVFRTSPAEMVGDGMVAELAYGSANVTYNPNGHRPATDPSKPSATEQTMAAAIDDVVNAMEKEGWAPDNPRDPGAFGKEVHRRVAARLRDKKEWMTNVYIDRETKKILSIGSPPEDASAKTYTQVDAIALRDKYRPKVGDVLHPDKIEIYEIKTSIEGRVDRRQLDRLREISGENPVRLARSKKVYRPTGYVPSVRYKRAVQALSLIGLAASAWAVIHHDEYEDEWHELEEAMDRIKAEKDRLQRMHAVQEASYLMINYLRNFVPHGVELIQLGQMYAIMIKWAEEEEGR
ncbi:MAG: hypothetical protein N3A38_14695 [Planctomycetota bacterium]|nr:hypothetical protein [Planctomycetota bacterium]